MTWDKRAKRTAKVRTFDTPTRGAAVAARVDAIKAKHPGCKCGAPWDATCHVLTDEAWDALAVPPITGEA
jgi:hypothetical protein